MSVNSAMTAIADKIRTLLGISGTMGLDGMSANLQTAVTTVDTQTDLITQIEAALEGKTALPTLSNAGTASDLASGKQLIDQSGNIVTGTHQCQAGVTVKRYPASGFGTFTTNSNGTATVNCGFQPDVVYIQGSQNYDDYHGQMNSASVTVAFDVENRENPLTALPEADGVYQMLWAKTNTGFAIEMIKFAFDWSATVPRETFSFVAIKYTA